MSEQPDETSEIVRAGMRATMTVAAQAAQRAMRAREQQQRERQAQSQQRAAELQARHDAERSAAVAALSPVSRDDWWATARPQDIADMYETAHTWEDLDPAARAAANRIRREVDTHYGIDPSSLDRSNDLNHDSLSEREQARLDSDAAVAISADAAAERVEHEGADTAYASASQSRADALWDSSGRREDTVASLEGVASAEAVRSCMLADTGQGARARSAVGPRTAQKILPVATSSLPGIAPHQTRKARH
ncbi:hypothetical protein [Aeromicrobium yanjiei]|uniref:Uncharacterized protein n=1 Tax=Aeromicrobium yanjiei TaxID=2662028 RepID=A0A5Q2MHW6_9ACTN|nr:hypothetical protein [Aeromicrobium yanjiei]QGG39905.1 hypothetical protein GEV26_00105 [Aeromicrobium yanjiei]